MTYKEYIDKVQNLENQLSQVTKEYIESNKIYNIGDYLKITFYNCSGDLIKRTCKIINIYPQMNRGFMDNKSWPTGELEYFAKYAWKDKNNEIIIGDVCYLGPLSHSYSTCGYARINWKEVKIEVIKESELLGLLWK